MKKKLTKDSTLKEIMDTPGAEPIMEKYRLPCLHCPMASQEINLLKIGEVAEMYEIDCNGFLKEINSLGGSEKAGSSKKRR